MKANSVFSPLEQFEVIPFLVFAIEQTGRVWLGLFHNADVVWSIAVVEIVFVVWLATRSVLFFPQVILVGLAEGVLTAGRMLRGTVDRAAQKHLVILVTFFVFIAILNGLGLIPWGFCVTAHLVVTQFLGGFAVLGLTVKGVLTLGIRWLNLFIPRNVPLLMLPFLSIIEIISYLSRMVSLSVRLFANMVAGHALLHILLGALLGVTNVQLGVLVIGLVVGLPTLLVFAIFVLEFGIAFLQAYVFSVLFLIYLTDSCKSH